MRMEESQVRSLLLFLSNQGFLSYDFKEDKAIICLLYTSDAADERSSVDLGGRRIIKKKNKTRSRRSRIIVTTKTKT